MVRRLIAWLLALICLCGVAAAQEPVYSTTRAFAAVLREAGVPFEAYGVDDMGEDSLAIMQGRHKIYCFFTADGQEVCFIAWYLIEYAPPQEAEVIRVCNRLNAASDGPRIYADASDCTVTVTLDVPLPFDAAGIVAYRGYQSIAAMLSAAVDALAPCDLLRIDDVVEEAPQPTAMPHPAATPRPTAVPQPTASPRPTAAPRAEEPARIVVTAPTARVRSGPGVNSPYLCTVKQGESYPVTGVSGDWYIITVNGRTGFISMSVSIPE